MDDDGDDGDDEDDRARDEDDILLQRLTALQSGGGRSVAAAAAAMRLLRDSGGRTPAEKARGASASGDEEVLRRAAHLLLRARSAPRGPLLAKTGVEEEQPAPRPALSLLANAVRRVVGTVVDLDRDSTKTGTVEVLASCAAPPSDCAQCLLPGQMVAYAIRPSQNLLDTGDTRVVDCKFSVVSLQALCNGTECSQDLQPYQKRVTWGVVDSGFNESSVPWNPDAVEFLFEAEPGQEVSRSLDGLSVDSTYWFVVEAPALPGAVSSFRVSYSVYASWNDSAQPWLIAVIVICVFFCCCCCCCCCVILVAAAVFLTTGAGGSGFGFVGLYLTQRGKYGDKQDTSEHYVDGSAPGTYHQQTAGPRPIGSGAGAGAGGAGGAGGGSQASSWREMGGDAGMF